MRAPAIAAISGAQYAGNVSSGSSTTFSRRDAAFSERLAEEVEFLHRRLRVLGTALLVRIGEVHAHIGRPATAIGSLNLPAMMVPGKLGLVQLKLYCSPPATERGLPVLPLPITR